MTIAAKHLDPLVGLDTHIILIPTPVGPVPTPLPHPYVGMVMDPMDYVPVIGATTYINRLPRGQAGSSGQALPPHIPMGGPFAKPPTNESEIFMGSATVLVDGEPQSFLSMPVLSCQDIGMPAPPRAKKKNVAKSLLLPTTVVLSIPMGMIVMIGGPPTISLMGMASKLGMAGLKKLATLGPVARKLKSASNRLHDAAEKLMKKLGLGDGARNGVHKALCTVTGHPVDVATGKVFAESIDFELSGVLPFRWERTWYSTSRYSGPLGHGWHHGYDQALLEDVDVVLFRTGDGRHVGLPRLKPGQTFYHRKERLTLIRDASGYEVRDRSGIAFRFVAVAGRANNDLPLAAIRDPAGSRVRFNYGAQGRLAQIVDAAGRSFELTLDARGRVVVLTGPHPDQAGQRVTLVRYAYDDKGDLVTATDALGHSTRYEYQQHLLVKETDANGLSFHFTYDGTDERARCTRTWGDGGIFDHQLSYSEGSTQLRNSLGSVGVLEHRAGTVYKTTDALGHVTLIEHNDYGEVVQETNELGETKRYQRDERGNVIELMAPGGARLKAKYDAQDRLVEVWDAVGGRWTWRYDAEGRLLEQRNPLGHTRTYVWNRSRPARVIDPRGNSTTFTTNEAGEVLAITGPDGSERGWVYDGLGRFVVEVDARGNRRKRERDLLGRTLRIHEPDGNLVEYSYDARGNIVQIQDRQQDVTLAYAGTGRLVSRSYAGGVIRFVYDTEEQLIEIVNERGFKYRFVLGPTGLIDAELGFDGIQRRFRRDAVGRVVRADLPGGAFSQYRYDPAGRVVERTHSDGSREWFAYRPDGDLIEAGNAASVVKLERDVIGRVVREAQGEDWVESEYDARNLLCGARSSRNARLDIERDAAGRVARLHASAGPAFASLGEPGAAASEPGPSFEARFVRDSFGLEVERVLPGAVRGRWQRDQLGREASQEVWAGGEQKVARRYEWGIEERLFWIMDAMEGPVRFGYGPFRNLERALRGEKLELRVSDAVGNLFRSPDCSDRAYGPSGQLLEAASAAGKTRYSYDDQGNLARKVEPDGRVWSYEWDAVGMLVRVIRPDRSVAEFAYDAFGRRISKKFRGKLTRWIWHHNVPLHEWVEIIPGEADLLAGSPQTAAADAAEAARTRAILTSQPAQGPPALAPGTADAPITWLFLPDTFAPLGKIVGNQCYGIITDHIGTPIRMYDGHGSEVWAADLDVFGEVRLLRGEREACAFRWPGQYEDTETGLYYNRFRYYSPEAGQYISQDPWRMIGGLAPYAYVHDPGIFRDPLGLIPEGDPGHGVYVIADKATGDPIYVGTTNDMSRRQAEHLESGKFDPDKHEFVPVIEDVTHGEARGAEQALMEDLGTKTKSKRGTPPNNVVDSVSASRLDNPSNPREAAFKQGYDKHKGVTHTDAKAKVAARCGG